MSSSINIAHVVKAVKSFNDVFAEMDKALWCLSKEARKDLLQAQSTEVLEEFIWTIKSWWGIQFVSSNIKALTAQALGTMEWSPTMFEESATFSVDAEQFAYSYVSTIVKTMISLGSPRQEFSLVSKVLHWLLPWRIPVYDSFVRKSIEVPTGWSHNDAYRKIVQCQFANARNFIAKGKEFVGGTDPKSLLRDLDKYHWLNGGGDISNAVVIRDPWHIVRKLGIDLS